MKYKRYKSLIFFGARVGFLGLLLWTLLNHVTGNFYHEGSTQDFFERGILSIVSYDELRKPFFDVVQLITTSSIYLVGFLSTILFVSDLSDKYFPILKYHAQSYHQYLRHRLVLLGIFYAKDCVVWILGLLPFFLYFKETDFLYLTGQMLLLHLSYFGVISCISRNSSTTLFLAFSVFLCQQLLIQYWVWSFLLAIFFIIIVNSCQFGEYLRGDEI